MIRWDCDKDFSATCISLPCILCTLSGVTLVRSILVLYIMIDLGGASDIVALRHLSHSDGSDKCRVDSRLTGHPGWDSSAANCTSTLSLSDPFLEALEAKIVPTRRRNGSLGKLHTKQAIHTLIEQIQHPIPPSRTLTIRHVITTTCSTGEELLAAPGLLGLRQRLIGLNCPNRGHEARFDGGGGG